MKVMIERETLISATETLEAYIGYSHELPTVLRAALAQPAEPVAWDEGSPCVEPRPAGMVYPPKPPPRHCGYIPDGSGVEWNAYDTLQMEAYARVAYAAGFAAAPVPPAPAVPLTEGQILGAIARGWCSPENARKEMDATLAIAIAAEVSALKIEGEA